MSSATLIFDIVGRDKASQTFDHVGKSVDQTSTKMEKLHKVGALAGKALLVGFAAVAAGAIDATKAAAEDQQGAEKLANSLKTAAGATDAQVASTEAWITKQGQALGVADDDLRPALAKLATATGSVSKAQSLASVAMNVSAATGKSLSSVTQALATSYSKNSVTALAKYGIATKDAHGNTLSLGQATDALAKKYNGAASGAAQTAAGKQKILTVQLSELREQIGYQLLPVMQKLATEGLKMVGWMSQNATTVEVVVGAIGGLLAVTWTASKAQAAWAVVTGTVSAGQGVYAAVTGTATAETLGQAIAVKVAAVASKAWAVAQWLLNAAMTANPIGLVVVAIAALVAGLVLAYQHSSTFRDIVNAAFSACSAAVTTAVNAIGAAVGWVTDFVRNHFTLFVALIGGPIGLAVLEVIKHWDKVRAVTSAAWALVKSVVTTEIAGVVAVVHGIEAIVTTIRNAWDNAKQAVTNKAGDIVAFVKGLPGKVVDGLSALSADLKGAFGGAVGDALSKVQDKGADIVTWFKNLPGKITGALDGLADTLRTVGGQIVSGLAHGISAAGALVDNAVQAIIDKIPSKIRHIMGIASPSKVTHQLGGFIAEGLADGITAKTGKVDKAAKALTDRLKSRLSSLKDSKSSLADSVAGAFTSNLFGAQDVAASTSTDENGVTTTTPAQSASSIFGASLQQTSSTLTALKGAFKTLEGWGVSPAFLANLFQSGNSGPILQLAQDQASATTDAGLFDSIQGMSASLGKSVGNDSYGTQISDVQSRISGKGKGNDSDTAGDTYVFNFNGDTLDSDAVITRVEQGLAKTKRRRGGRKLAFEAA